MSRRPPALSVHRLSKSYRRKPVLSGLSIEVLDGEAVAIIGPNGAGKSTFLGCVTGNRVPDSGTVRILGSDPFTEARDTASKLGFVPESPFLYPELTVRETLRFVAEVRGFSTDESLGESERLLELFGLQGAVDTLCGELSQGMGRKVAIIVALLHQPRLLVLDEALNGLDESSATALLDELEARRADGASILLASHDLRLLAAVCTRGLLLAPGGFEILEGAAWESWRGSPRTGAPRVVVD